MELSDIQEKVFREYIKNNYYDEWTDKTLNPKRQKVYDIAELGLICTEVTEAIEEIRNFDTDKKKLSLELADIIIRTLNFASRKGIDIEQSILFKHEKNLKRLALHGREV